LKDKTTISQDELENKLVQLYSNKVPQTTLFESPSREEILNAAYQLLNLEVAYSPKK
jgi:hypothetical protein